VTALVALALSAPSAPHDAAGGPAGTATLTLTSSGYPTNAGKIFGWGHDQWGDEFVEPVRHHVWTINHPRLVDDQHGMLTINASGKERNVSATAHGHARRVGRWEARIRSQQYGHGRTPYRVMMELIPASASHYDCGRRSIVMASYALGRHRAHVYVRNGAQEFKYGKTRDLGHGLFHTYAIELTKHRVSWFVDTHVIMTERRPAALTGARYTVRFRLHSTTAKRKNAARMQMDWVRYYTLARPDKHSVKAPQAIQARDSAHCAA
jgi:hypothetical protein